MSTGRGRPAKESSFTKIFMFRGVREHERMLDELEDKLGKSRGDVLREALEKYYSFKILGQMTYFD